MILLYITGQETKYEQACPVIEKNKYVFAVRMLAGCLITWGSLFHSHGALKEEI